jgi:hypothetical protein
MVAQEAPDRASASSGRIATREYGKISITQSPNAVNRAALFGFSIAPTCAQRRINRAPALNNNDGFRRKDEPSIKQLEGRLQ